MRTACLLAMSMNSFSGAEGQLRLAAPCSDGMVLQREGLAPLWGSARPGDVVQITADWSPEQVRVVADARGSWRADVPTPAAGGPYTIRVSADRELVIQDVMIGEVWLCSGQSNMEWRVAPGPIGGVLDHEAVIAAAHHPRMRQFDVANTAAAHPCDDVRGSWSVCSPETVGSFSAVAYFFACELERELDVPVGVINASWSGTRIQAWLPERVAASSESLAAEWAAFRSQREERERAGAAGSGALDPQTLTVLHNGMVAPLVPYALRGFLWYQGESNRLEHERYGALQVALVDGLREAWGGSQKPFYYVQIAPFAYDDDRGEAGALRDVQRRCMTQANTGMAVTMDIGNPGDIHPRNKQEVGRRLALWALACTYGVERQSYSGPLLAETELEGATMRLRFDHAEGGLISAGDHLTGFEIAGADRKFARARAVIEGDCVLLSSREVEQPVAARYGFAAASQPILFNKAWLPAAAFRTDGWPLR